MNPKKPALPHLRTTASAGRVHFGLSTYSYLEDLSDVSLAFECTPERAEDIGFELLGVAANARKIASKFPTFVPL